MKKNLLLILITLLILIAIPFSFANDNVTEEMSIEQTDVIDADDTLSITDENTPISEEDDYNEIIYVSTDGDDNNNGNITNPTATVSKAIELASREENTAHKIIINNGSYYEYDLNINSELEIIGNGNVIIGAEKKSDLTARILTIDTTKEVKISGITFQNGREAEGGAILINNGKVIIDNCIFINNTAIDGGAIYWNANNGTLTNSIFRQNRAKNGAAICWGGVNEETLKNYGDNGVIYNITVDNNDNAHSQGLCMGLAVYSNNVKVLNSRFINNCGHIRTTGGSLFIQGKNITIDNCLFENNTMSQSPAIQCDGDDAKIINCKFINNTVDYDGRGGAIDIQSTNALVYNNIFINNGGEDCYNGGAISINYIDQDLRAIINLTSNKFINNTAEFGSAIFINGGAENYCEFKNIIIEDNLFDGNEGRTGAGIYILFVTIEEDGNISTVIIKDNEFKNQRALFSSCMHIDSSSVLLKNNTIINCTSIDRNNHIFNNEGYISGELNLIVNNNETIELLSGRHILVNVTLYDDNGNGISGGNITLIVEGTYISEEGYLAEFGKVSIDFYSSEYGIFNISADYLNGDKPIVKNSQIISIPYNISIYFNQTEGLANNTLSIPVQVIILEGLSQYYLDNENITVLFNNDEFKVPIKEGFGTINLNLPEENGTYDLSVSYDIKRITKSIVVNDNSAVISVNGLSFRPHSGNLIVTLKDIYGNPLINETLNVKIDNLEKDYRTNENGEIIMPLDLETGKHSIAAIFKGSSYKPCEFDGELDIDYLKSVLTGTDMTMSYKDGSSYIVRLTDSNSNPIANKNVILKINNKKYNRVTDSNGVVTLLLNFEPGKYAITSQFLGNSEYYSTSTTNTITIKSIGKLVGSNIKMFYTAKKSYKVRLFNANGKAVGAGKVIKLTLNGKTVNVKTNKQGYTVLKISLKPKTYTIKATYGKLQIKNKITVKPLLTAKNISKKKSKKIKFKAKLVNNKGKVVKGKKLTFKIKGKTYKVKTNKKGIATLTLKNLKVGKYTIKTKYGKSTIKNTIRIK